MGVGAARRARLVAEDVLHLAELFVEVGRARERRCVARRVVHVAVTVDEAGRLRAIRARNLGYLAELEVGVFLLNWDRGFLLKGGLFAELQEEVVFVELKTRKRAGK